MLASRIINFRDSVVWKFLIKIQETILITTSIITILIICAEVVLRYFLHADLFGYEEIVIICAMWLYFLGASYAMHNKSHISASMVDIFLKEKALKYVEILSSIINTVVSISFALLAYDFFFWALEKKAFTTGLKIPLLYSQSALFFGYILLAFYSLIYTIEDVVLFIGDKKEKGDT